MNESMPADRSPLDVRCGPCDHRWTVAYLPMPAALVAAALRGARCPMCGSAARQHFFAADPLPWPPRQPASAEQTGVTA